MTEPTSPPVEAEAASRGALAGRTVLVARAPDRAAGLVERLRAAGAEVVAAPVIERAPAHDQDALDDAVRGVADDRYAWVAVTSVNAVDALLGAAARTSRGLAGTARWAAVGQKTRRALEAAGIDVDLVPGEATAAGLVAAFPRPQAGSSGARVLLPLGDLASPTLMEGVTALGWSPDVVTAYRTTTRDLPAAVVTRPYDAVVVTSGSVAREVARQLGTHAPAVAIGTPSAQAARDAGLHVAAVAEHPVDDALAAAVVTALSPTAARPQQTDARPQEELK